MKKLTDDFNPRKNTYIIFNVQSKNKLIFVHNKVIRKQCNLAGIYSRSCTHPGQPKLCFHWYILYENLTAKITNNNNNALTFVLCFIFRQNCSTYFTKDTF